MARAKKKRKILFIHHGRIMGGAPTSMLMLIKQLDKNRYTPKVLFLFENAEIEKICKEENIEYRVLSGFFFKRLYRIWGFSAAEPIKLKYLFRIYPCMLNLLSWLFVSCHYAKKIIREESPDIVHLNSLFLTDWLVGLRDFKVTKIVHVREPLRTDGIIGQHIIRWILKKYATAIFAISEDNKSRINIPKVVVVYNFLAPPNPRRIDCIKSEVSVLYLGGDLKIKGFDTLMKSASFLDPSILIRVAGHVKANQYEFPSNVELIGIVKDVYKTMYECDILVFPSTRPHFAKPIIEAAMCKLPVIASNVTGMEEVVKDGVNGILVTPSDPCELAKAINLLAGDSSLRREMGESNFKMAQEKFSVQANLPKILDVYEGQFLT